MLTVVNTKELVADLKKVLKGKKVAISDDYRPEVEFRDYNDAVYMINVFNEKYPQYSDVYWVWEESNEDYSGTLYVENIYSSDIVTYGNKVCHSLVEKIYSDKAKAKAVIKNTYSKVCKSLGVPDKNMKDSIKMKSLVFEDSDDFDFLRFDIECADLEIATQVHQLIEAESNDMLEKLLQRDALYVVRGWVAYKV